MKILIDGYGSIGRQYSKHLGTSNELFVHDPYIKLDEGESGIRLVREVSPNQYDLIVIASPSGTHVDKLIQYQASNAFLLVEKPLAISLTEVNAYKKLLSENPSISERAVVSSPRRFTQATEMLRERYSSIHESAQDGFFRFSHSLRRMRGNNWRDSYVANSGDPLSIVLDCIHELDIAVSIFGPIRSIDIMSSFSSSLNKTPLVAMVRCAHNDGKRSYHHFDFCSDVKIRMMTVRGHVGTYSVQEIGKPASEIRVDTALVMEDSQYTETHQEYIALDRINPLFRQVDKIIEEGISGNEKYFCSLDNAIDICQAIIDADIMLME